MVIVNHYVEGATVSLGANFMKQGVSTDPTTISLKVKSPDDVTTEYTYAGGQITRDSTGVYSKIITANQVGLWWYYWQGTGAVEAVNEWKFDVTEKHVG